MVQIQAVDLRTRQSGNDNTPGTIRHLFEPLPERNPDKERVRKINTAIGKRFRTADYRQKLAEAIDLLLPKPEVMFVIVERGEKPAIPTDLHNRVYRDLGTPCPMVITGGVLSRTNFEVIQKFVVRSQFQDPRKLFSHISVSQMDAYFSRGKEPDSFLWKLLHRNIRGTGFTMEENQAVGDDKSVDVDVDIEVTLSSIDNYPTTSVGWAAAIAYKADKLIHRMNLSRRHQNLSGAAISSPKTNDITSLTVDRLPVGSNPSEISRLLETVGVDLIMEGVASQPLRCY